MVVDESVGGHIAGPARRFGLGCVANLEQPDSFAAAQEVVANLGEYRRRCVDYAQKNWISSTRRGNTTASTANYYGSKLPVSGTVVIVAYCSRAEIGECLQALQQLAAQGSIKVIVADNASPDGTAQFVADNYPWVLLIRSRYNGGFAYGNNQGFRYSVGDWTLFLNPDTRIISPAIEILAAYLAEHPQVGCAGPQIICSDGRVERSTFPFQNVWISLLNAFGLTYWLPVNHIDNRWRMMHNPINSASVDRLLGAAMMVRNCALESVGGFDESYFLYSEEEDLSLRLKRAGWETHYHPPARVQHLGGASAKSNPPLSVASANWSRCLFVCKHYGPAAGEIVRWTWFICIAMRMFLAALCLWNKNRRNMLAGYCLSLKSLLMLSYFARNLRPLRPDNNPTGAV